MAAEGRTVIFISHKLHEVKAVADRVTVLRGGQVGRDRARPPTRRRASLAALMVGRERRRCGRRASARRRPRRGRCSRCDGLWAERRPRRAGACAASRSTCARGEIVAIAGRRRQRPARARRGDHRDARRASGGTCGSTAGGCGRGDAREAIRAGVALRPRGPARHRRRAGPQHRRRTSCSSRTARAESRAGRCSGCRRDPRARASELIERYDVTAPGPETPARAALRRQPAEGRARRASSRASRACSSPPRRPAGLDVGAIETVHALPARGRGRRRRRAADQRGPRRDPRARRPDRGACTRARSPARSTRGDGDARGDRPADGRRAPRVMRVRAPARRSRAGCSLAVPVGSLGRRVRSSIGARARSRPATTPVAHLPAALRRRRFVGSDGAGRRRSSRRRRSLFTGLAAAAAFRMSLFNIGGEGQLYIGAIAGAGVGPRARRTSRAGCRSPR